MTKAEALMQARKIRLMKIALILGIIAGGIVIYLLAGIYSNTEPKQQIIYHPDAIGI